MSQKASKTSIRQLLEKVLPANRFLRSVSILAGGTAASQIVVAIASPLITRLYSPEDFGLLAVYSSLLMTLGVIASLRYQLAIPLPSDHREAAHVVVLSLLVVIGMTLLVLFAVILFRHQISQAVNIPSMANYLWLLPPGLFLLGIYQVLNYWAIRIKAFTAIARTKLAQSLSMVVIQIGGYTMGPVSLLFAQISGQAAGSISLGVLAIHSQWELFQSVRPKNIFEVAKRYKRFLFFSTWAGALNSAGTQLPPLLFSALFSPASAGLYILAHSVLSLPLAVIGKAIGDVFFSSAPEAQRNGTLSDLVSSLNNKLAQIAMPPALFLFIAGPDIFDLVFGENWRIAGEVARWLSPMLYIQFIVSPLSLIFSILERQIYGLVLQGVLFFSRIGVIFLTWRLTGEFMNTVLFYGIISCLVYLLNLFSILHVTRINLFYVLIPSLKVFPVSLFLVLPILISYLSGKSDILFCITCVLSFFMVLLFYIYLIKKDKWPS